jgi:hypothetical protein
MATKFLALAAVSIPEVLGVDDRGRGVMDWIKVLNKHVLHTYTDLTPLEWQAWIKIMSLTATLEEEPTRNQMLQYVHHRTLTSLQDKLKEHSTTLQDILKKVLSDAQEVVKKREYWKDKKKEKRALEQNVQQDIQEKSLLRLEKSRVDKIRLNNKERGFHPPSLTDVSAYCKERKNTINPQTFISHYESNGWMVGKNKMKDWKAAIRGWETRGGDNAGRGTGNRSGGPGTPIQAEYVGEVQEPLSEAQIAANLVRVREFIG